MKKIFYLFALLAFSLEYSYSQVIKLENGASISWTNYSSQASVGYSGGIGLNYLEKKRFMLNSKLAFFKRSEISTLQYLPQEEMNIIINYLSFDSTVRFKQPIWKGICFVGVGPSVDFKLHSKYQTESIMNNFVLQKGDFHSQDIVVNILAECGYIVDIKNWRMELNLAYKNNLTKINMETRKGFVSHVLICSIGLGYKFNL